MLTNVLAELYQRDLEKLKAEIGLYSHEKDLWIMRGEISNSAGNLALHLAGNLKHFFGAVLGGTDFIRDRDSEFSERELPREAIIAAIDEEAEAVRTTLAGLSAEDLAANYPIDVFGRQMTTEYFIVHLATHLNYHLGQINYHRRLLAS